MSAIDLGLENYSEDEHSYSIKGENKIYSAFGDGKIPFVNATDIAAVAFHALTDSEPPNTDYRVLGPELLTHDQVFHPIALLESIFVTRDRDGALTVIRSLRLQQNSANLWAAKSKMSD